MSAAALTVPGIFRRGGLLEGQGLASSAVLVEELTIGELGEGLSSGRFTSSLLVQSYLDRIEALDHRGPMLHAMIETNPEAIELANALDAERRAGKVRGPLHGIPIIVKDNIGTADKMHTSAGSFALATSIAPADAFLVTRLREAGAIILGKSNMSEWSSFRSTHPSSGWSGRGGQTRNPYALDRSPAGSSSGTAVAVAASYAAAAVGTETDGSIVCPSSACSVVGLKPTVGLISRSGIIPVARSQDTAGPMGRTVTDVAILLNALVGADDEDEATKASRGRALADYTKFLRSDALDGAVIGLMRPTFFGYSAEFEATRAIDSLESAGAKVEMIDVPHIDEYADSEKLVLLYEFKDGINRYLASLGPDAPVKSLREIIVYNATHASSETHFFGQELLEEADAMGDLDDKEYKQALARNIRLSRTEGLDVVFDRFNLDAIVTPTMPPAWLIDLVNGDPVVGTSSGAAAVSGYPSITVPIGYQRGLPVGLSFIGRAWNEPKLISYAYALEQSLKVRRPPRYLPTVDLTVTD
jgi:amidase